MEKLFVSEKPLLRIRYLQAALVVFLGLFVVALPAFAQIDQGSFTGTVTDSTGAVIQGAAITLTDVDTGLVLHAQTDSDGIYAFPPTKIGNFTLTAAHPGFKTTTRENIHLDVQERLNVPLVLLPGAVSQSVVVTSAPPLIQTQDASTGQVMSTVTIDHTPLNGRNWVYIAQLASGVTSGGTSGSPGAGTGDFSANGQRSTQNDFILDGVDNNSGSPNLENQASWGVLPPPDALEEFKIQTGDFSAEFGHSAGAVVNTSIKSGTNNFHGDAWEYLRNDALDARDFDALTVPKYRENQFGATLGMPLIKNKLFFFAYSEANRIVYGNPTTTTVPTALMRQGNFTELLNPALTSQGRAIQLYQPGSAGTQALSCGSQANVICSANIDAVAQNILNLYPVPNANSGKVFNNHVSNLTAVNNTWQWGSRVDWDISAANQAFVRFNYWNEPSHVPPPLGFPLDGSTVNNQEINLAQNFALSETHIFTPTTSNEFRVGYNFGNFAALQSDYNSDNSTGLGLGGIPFAAENGGLPNATVSGITAFGSKTFLPNHTWTDQYQILDNITAIRGNHSMRFGVDFQSMRSIAIVPPAARGTYSYTGRFTSVPGQNFTGYGVADFLLNQMFSATLSNLNTYHEAQWYRAAYFQDDWRLGGRLTLNLGLRYDYYEPGQEINGRQASFQFAGPALPGEGHGTLLYPAQQKNIVFAPGFLNYLTQNQINIGFSNNPSLTDAQKTNFAPRVGISYATDKSTVFRAGFGIFYGGIEPIGGPSFLENYPFQFTSNFSSPNACTPGNCNADGLDLETGFQQALSQGLENFASQPSLPGLQPQLKTEYTENYNLSFERSLANNLAATIAYVGSVSRHLQVTENVNSPAALTDPRLNSNLAKPFSTLGATSISDFAGAATYNSLQAKLEKRYTNGLTFLGTYTWAHTMDDAVLSFGSSIDSGYRDVDLIGILNDFSNSRWDVRQRATFNGYYNLPFGSGHRFLAGGGVKNALFGGWATDLEFTAQTGFPISVKTDLGSSGPNGAGADAILIHNPFQPGGSPDPSNPGVSCAQQTRTKLHWYNPCAFANPPIAFPQASVAGSPISTMEIEGMAALPYLGGRRLSVPGPGYERINMSLFKDVSTFREQYLQLRVDAFNVLNTPAYGQPSTADDSSNGGLITAPQSFQNNTPDARFFQLSAKYLF